MAAPEPADILGIPITFTGVAIIAAALFATAGWYFTNRTQLVLDRRRHTYAVFQSYRERVLSNIEEVRSILRKKEFPKFGERPLTKEMEIVENLLEEFEFISAAIFRGDIDEKFMVSCEYTRLTQLYDLLSDYIEEGRLVRSQPNMYMNLQMLSARWKSYYDTDTMLMRLGLWPTVREFVIMRPYIPIRRAPEALPMPGAP